jgi:hypothetical protein
MKNISRIGGRLLAGSLLAWGAIQPLPAAESPTLPPLTTVKGSPRLPGKFVWADLVTDDIPQARKFYSGLLGWNFREVGNYSIAYNAERPVAGIFAMKRPADKPDAKPRWLGYVSVNQVSKAVRTVEAKGGRVLAAPKKIPHRGEQAICADPDGAVFGVIKSSSGDPQDFLPDVGDWIWIQLLSRDSRLAAEFYRDVVGYEILEDTSPARLNDYVLAGDGYARATVRTIPPDKQGKVRANWMPVVRVADINAAVAKAAALGGQVQLKPNPELFHGKVAVVSDPTGAAIGLLEWTGESSKGGL